MLALVSFWTLLPEQQPGIVIEQLNDDENEWKGRYEFPAYRHSHTSQVWFEEQLCGFNLPLCPLGYTQKTCIHMHKSTHPHVRMHTCLHALRITQEASFQWQTKDPRRCLLLCNWEAQQSFISRYALYQQTCQIVCAHAPPPPPNTLLKQFSHSPVKVSANFI